MTKPMSRYLSLWLVCLLVGCPAPTGKTPPGVGMPKPKPTASTPSGIDLMVPGPVSPPPSPGSGILGPAVVSPIISRDGAGIISRDGAGIISRDGAGIISNDGASISGVVKLPAGIISRDGAGIISRDGAGIISNDGASIISNDGASYRLAALGADIPIRKQFVYLLNAESKLVLAANGEPITAETDGNGRFEFKGFTNRQNLLIAVKLHDEKGLMTAYLSRSDESRRTVDLSLASTLTTTYIQEKYVRPQWDQVGILERLPAELEVAARAAVVQASAKLAAAPTDLTAASVLDVVMGLRKQEATVESRFIEVEQVMLAGLRDQGSGELANSIESDALDLAVGPVSQLAFASTATQRVWHKDAQGRLVPLAGNGFTPDAATAQGTAAPGDGGRATSAPIDPAAVAYMLDGSLLIADAATRRIRKVGSDGIITTYTGSDLWEDLRDFVVEPGGSLLVATHSGVWRVPVGGQPTLLTGESRTFNPLTWASTEPTGDGGPPLAAKFRNIQNISRDPRTGDLYIFDAGGAVSRVTADRIHRVAGSGKPGYAGDGGQAVASQIGLAGSVFCQPDGSYLIADPYNHRIRQVKDGIITTFAGTGEPTFAGDGGAMLAAGLYAPITPAAAPDGTIYFIDRGYVRMIRDGLVKTIIGGTRGFDSPKPANTVQMLQPRELTYDADTHSMYVEDERHVWRWTLNDNKMVSVFGGPAGSLPAYEGVSAQATGLTQPRGFLKLGTDSFAVMASDPNNFLGRIVKVDGGQLSLLAGGASQLGDFELDEPATQTSVISGDGGLVEIDGWYYYTVAINGHIRRFRAGGATERVAGYGAAGSQNDGRLPALQWRFTRIVSLAKTQDGQLGFSTPTSIFKFNPATGLLARISGLTNGQDIPDGGSADEAKLFEPTGLHWDAEGDIYFTEPSRGRVRRVNTRTNRVDLIAGAGSPNLSGDTVDTGLGVPSGLAIDKSGDLYIADQRHGQVKIVPKAQLKPR